MQVKNRQNLIFFFIFSYVILLATPLFAHNKPYSKNEEYPEEIQRNQFPDDFLFGTSTSSYQVEGAYIEDGKSLSIWDVYSHIPGKVKNGDNGDIADDHYHRYMEDIEIIHSLGVNAYRFSISWPRILPRGKFGGVNPKGILFYNKIIDHLVLRGIVPFVTIYHWDHPQLLQEMYGSWLNPQIREDFVHFATICFKEFGDRVKYWTTINEPGHYVEYAYILGIEPPGHCSPPFGNCSAGDSDTEPLIVMHNLIISHAMAVDVYRKQFQAKQGGFIGIVLDSLMFEPLRDIEDDKEAANRALAFNIPWALDPIIYGHYPKEMRECKGLDKVLPKFSQTEKELLLRTNTDFIGINYYTATYVKDCLNSPCPPDSDRPIRGFVDPTGIRDGIPIGELAGMDKFFVVPSGIEKLVDYIKIRYNNKPMFITENGFASPLDESEQQSIQDENRIRFHKAHLSALHNSIRKGANVRGYFVWSFMDNFEWASGYMIKFGLYYVDRASLQRTPKLSAKWFSNFLTNFTDPSFVTHVSL